MDYHKLLLSLASNDIVDAQDFDEKLQKILNRTLPALPEDIRKLISINDENSDMQSFRYQYLHALVYTLQGLQHSHIENSNEFYSVSELHTVKIAIELVVSIGILPCLLPGVGIELSKLCPKAARLKPEQLTDIQKHERLCFSTQHILNMYDDVMLRPVILNQLGPLVTALLQLSHVPLMKPTENSSALEKTTLDAKSFVMTVSLYNKLKKEQEKFSANLLTLLDNSPQSMVIKELMVILGSKATPKWLRRYTQKYLIIRIMQTNGVISLINALCDDVLDLGVHWEKLDTASRLIAASHGDDKDLYYKSICSQLLDLLSSKNIRHASIIANCCILALYECNPDVCTKSIIDVIASPLTVTTKKTHGEKELEECLDNLTKCFVTVEEKFKQLPCAIISKLSVPLFCVHNKINTSACALKPKVKQLLLRLLYDKSLQDELFSAVLGHNLTGKCGPYAKIQFGPNGGVEVVGLEEVPPFAEYADNLFNLVASIETLSVSLFLYLLKFLTSLNENTYSNRPQNMLETEDDAVDCMEKHLIAMKLLSDLANTSTVQEAQIKNPEPLFTFIKSLFNRYTEKTEVDESADCEILYVSLMLIKMIVSDEKVLPDRTSFNDFATFLKERSKVSKLPIQLATLIDELTEVIEKPQHTGPKFYQDVSTASKELNEFEQAIKDLGDPLLPVRAHGIVTLTKLIESRNPCAIARKSVILRLFQENLNHEDSFVYLAAINGLCALATSYPEIIIESLVQEYIDMPQRISSGEISSETRMKLGEILVKTTRSLGEMTTVHKNILINGFLCAVRDSDPLIRASSLSCLGELCKVLGFRLGNIVTEVIYCISCIIKSDKVPECRRAAVLVSTLLLRGLGRDVLTSLGSELVGLFRGLKHLRDVDDDPVVRLHAQLSLEEFDDIVQQFLCAPLKMEKTIFLLPSS